MSSPALTLYRESLRALRGIPALSIRRKMAYNIRELFAIYKDAPTAKVAEVLEDATHDLTLLREMLKGRPEHVNSIFRAIEQKETGHDSQQILPL